MKLIALTLLMAASPGPDADGGALGKMRDDVRDAPDDKDRTKKPQQRRRRTRDEDAEESSLLEALFVDLLGYGILVSVARVSEPAPADELKPRKAGDALLPLVRADLGYAWLTQNVESFGVLGELGWGPFAVTGGFSRLSESGSDGRLTDALELVDFSGAVRMSFGSYVELDIAGGVGAVDEDNGFILSTPLRIHPSKYVGVEVSPSWIFINGTTFDSYRVVVTGGLPYCSIHAGMQAYRTESVDLIGGTVGVTVRY